MRIKKKSEKFNNFNQNYLIPIKFRIKNKNQNKRLLFKGLFKCFVQVLKGLHQCTVFIRFQGNFARRNGAPVQAFQNGWVTVQFCIIHGYLNNWRHLVFVL
jgi:hypothetical protein